MSTNSRWVGSCGSPAGIAGSGTIALFSEFSSGLGERKRGPLFALVPIEMSSSEAAAAQIEFELARAPPEPSLASLRLLSCLRMRAVLDSCPAGAVAVSFMPSASFCVLNAVVKSFANVGMFCAPPVAAVISVATFCADG